MKISYLGHSSFLLQSSGGTRVVTDPYGEVGLVFPRIEADAVTVSHGHFDHCNVSAVEGSPAVFDKAGGHRIGDITTNAIERYHDEVQGKKRGKNLVFCFEIDGLRVCHLGDIGENCSEELLALLRPVDVLLIPVGGNYTIDAWEAKKYVQGLAPAVIIPMHYRVNGLTVDIATPEAFLGRFEGVEHAGATIELTKNDIGKFSKIICMERVTSWN